MTDVLDHTPRPRRGTPWPPPPHEAARSRPRCGGARPRCCGWSTPFVRIPSAEAVAHPASGPTSLPGRARCSRIARGRSGTPRPCVGFGPLYLLEHRVGGGSGRGPDDLGGAPNVDAARARKREERGGEILAGVEGAPLSEPLVVLGRCSSHHRDRPRTHHNGLIVPGGLNNSWMSGTLRESNVYRTGCSRQNNVAAAHTIGSEPPLVRNPRSILT